MYRVQSTLYTLHCTVYTVPLRKKEKKRLLDTKVKGEKKKKTIVKKTALNLIITDRIAVPHMSSEVFSPTAWPHVQDSMWAAFQQ